MNKQFLLLVFTAALAIPAFSQDATMLHLMAPKLGDVCTYRRTDQLFHKGELIQVQKMSVVSIAGDEVTWRTEVTERGPWGSNPVGTVYYQIRNAYGYVDVTARTYAPYSPILGESAKNGPDITPNADLGKVTYTFAQQRTGNSGTTTVKGKASGWEDADVAGHKSRVLRLTWDGHWQTNGDPSYPRGYNGTLRITYTVSADTPCLISESSRVEGSMTPGEAFLMELVSQDVN
jgi:hypothetical protein